METRYVINRCLIVRRKEALKKRLSLCSVCTQRHTLNVHASGG